MTIMADKDVGSAVAALIATSEDGNDDSVSRKEALDYYFQRARGDEPAGGSSVVSGDLSAMTEAVLSQMLDAFTTDNAIEFEPNSAEDEQQAQLESDVVSYLVMEANDGYVTFAQAIKDALLLRNGIMKTWVDEKVSVTETSYEHVSPEAFVQLTTPTPNTQIDVLEFEDDKLKIRSTFTNRALIVEPIPIENFMVTQGWHKLDLQDVPFCAEIKSETRSSLIEQGFKKSVINNMPAGKVSRTDETSRNPADATPSEVTPDKSQDIIQVYVCYILLDVDGDGISERRRVLYANGEVLENELVGTVPYSAGSAFIASHRFVGISLFDKLKQVQDINTSLWRALLDNANATNLSRIAYKGGAVDMDMLEDGRVNGLIECEDPLTDLKALTVPDISMGILANMSYMKSIRGEMGGASLELASGQMQLGSNQVGSEGLDRAYSVMEQLAAMMAKNIAETLVKQTFLIAHATLRSHFDIPVNIKKGGKWQTATPSEWQPRKRMNVKIGMSAGERNRKIAALQAVVDRQVGLNDMGLDGIMVDASNFHNALIDLARASEVDNPERYYLDPTSDEALEEIERKQQANSFEEDNNRAIMSQAVGLEQLKIAMDKYKTDNDLRFKYYDSALGAEVEEAKIVGGATKDLTNAQEQGRQKANGSTEGSETIEVPASLGQPDTTGLSK